MGAGRSRRVQAQFTQQQGVQHHIISFGGCGAPPAPAFGGLPFGAPLFF